LETDSLLESFDKSTLGVTQMESKIFKCELTLANELEIIQQSAHCLAAYGVTCELGTGKIL
jgi:hypothetical protein